MVHIYCQGQYTKERGWWRLSEVAETGTAGKLMETKAGNTRLALVSLPVFQEV